MMWLKIGIVVTLLTYLYWAIQRMRRRRNGGCGSGRDCQGCSACAEKPREDDK